METIAVGIREFRADLAEHIAAALPVAVTRHGQTVGYFIPTQSHLGAELAALKQASAGLHQLLASQGVSEDEIVNEFKIARRLASAVPKKSPVTRT